MKLYHGSPQNFNILKPQKARGINEFENITGVFLTKTFLHASLYAIGKTLKGKTAFGVSKNKLVILGNLNPKAGYVYEVKVKNPIKGHLGQYASEEELKPIKKTKVFPKDYEQYFIRVKSKEEILKNLRANSK
ncbi:MAG: hypothetical protein KJ566_01890 [Nanoarchaeota archaeon]|nr:hypothetical protein [Nanoarchaeota archaeon]